MYRATKLLLFMFLISCTTGKDTSQTTILPLKKTDDLYDPYLKTYAYSQVNNSILILLPLSGSNQEIGKSILNACILSVKTSKVNDIDFYVIDTSDSSIDKFSLHEKFKNKNLKAIIGPVFFHEAKQYGALFPNIPILTLSNNLKINNNHTVACGLSPKDEINVLFSFAKSQKIDSFIIMLPNGEFGDQILSLIKEELKNQDLEEDVEIVRYSSISRKNATKFIRNSTKKATFVIDPILTIEQLDNIHVFTVSSSALSNNEAWNGAIFAFVYNEKQSNFIEKYQSVFEKKPTILDMIGYDISNALCESVIDKKTIWGNNYSGCFGDFSIDKNTGLKRDLHVFRIENNQKIELSTTQDYEK